jgi:hypothetical protein
VRRQPVDAKIPQLYSVCSLGSPVHLENGQRILVFQRIGIANEPDALINAYGDMVDWMTGAQIFNIMLV